MSRFSIKALTALRNWITVKVSIPILTEGQFLQCQLLPHFVSDSDTLHGQIFIALADRPGFEVRRKNVTAKFVAADDPRTLSWGLDSLHLKTGWTFTSSLQQNMYKTNKRRHYLFVLIIESWTHNQQCVSHNTFNIIIL